MRIDNWSLLKTIWLFWGIVALAVACRQSRDPAGERRTDTTLSQAEQATTTETALQSVTALPSATQQVPTEISVDVSTPLPTATSPPVSLKDQEMLTVAPAVTPTLTNTTVPETTPMTTSTADTAPLVTSTVTLVSPSATATNTAMSPELPTETPVSPITVSPTPSSIPSLTPLPTLTSTMTPTSPVTSQHFSDCAIRTGNNATLLLPVEASIAGNLILEPGDEIAFFSPNGSICAGMANWLGENMAVTAWGDNTQTEAVDGLLAGEEIQIHIWDVSTGIEYVAVDVQFSLGDGIYQVDSFHVISSLTVTPS